MEKILNDDEKIRKAEQIYYRRNNIDAYNDKHKNKTNIKDRFFLHLIIMFNIAVIIFAIQNRDNIFKEQFLNQINEYNINISSNITNYIRNAIRSNEKIEIKNNEENVELKDDSYKIVENDSEGEENVTIDNNANNE